MNDIDYSDDAEIWDWNTGIDARFVTLLKDHGITTMGQLLSLQVAAWVHNTWGVGSKARSQINRAKETIATRRHDNARCLNCTHFRRSHTSGKYRCNTMGCVEDCQAFQDSAPFAVDEDSESRVHMIWPADLKARVQELVGPRNLTDFVIGAVNRELLGTRREPAPDPIFVDRDEAIRVVIEKLEGHIATDAVSLFDNARWGIDALLDEGWLMVRAESIQ